MEVTRLAGLQLQIRAELDDSGPTRATRVTLLVWLLYVVYTIWDVCRTLERVCRPMYVTRWAGS